MPPRGYQPIDGPAAYNQAVQKLLFGETRRCSRRGAC
jgi:aromatic-amino-acid transaminase